MKKTSGLLLGSFLLFQGVVYAEDNPALPGFDQQGSDLEAIEIADRTMARMGGRQAWDRTRYISWRFFGGRLHVWDKHTGDIRFEQDDLIVLMNLHSKAGRAWQGGEAVVDPDTLKAKLEKGYRAWINDSYWLVMPYKLKDSGVTLKYKGEGQTESGLAADVLELTFKGVGVTPDNKYDVWVDRADHLVRQWAFYPKYADAEPRFVGPWDKWKQYGDIWLSDGRGKRNHTEVAVHGTLPRALFEDPAAQLGQ